MAFGRFPGDGDGNTDEAVTLAVFAGPGFEETGQNSGFRRGGLFVEFGDDLSRE